MDNPVFRLQGVSFIGYQSFDFSGVIETIASLEPSTIFIDHCQNYQSSLDAALQGHSQEQYAKIANSEGLDVRLYEDFAVPLATMARSSKASQLRCIDLPAYATAVAPMYCDRECSVFEQAARCFTMARRARQHIIKDAQPLVVLTSDLNLYSVLSHYIGFTRLDASRIETMAAQSYEEYNRNVLQRMGSIQLAASDDRIGMQHDDIAGEVRRLTGLIAQGYQFNDAQAQDFRSLIALLSESTFWVFKRRVMDNDAMASAIADMRKILSDKITQGKFRLEFLE